MEQNSSSMPPKEPRLVTRFLLDFNPPTVTAQEQKIRVIYDKLRKHHIPQKYNPPELEDAKQLYIAHLNVNKPETPVAGPVGLQVDWYFKTSRKALDGAWKTTKPDTDNLNKLLKDCMTKTGFWYDDAQVVREVITKRWVSDGPGIVISVYDLAPDAKDELDRKISRKNLHPQT